MEEGKDNSAEEEILKGVTAMVYAGKPLLPIFYSMRLISIVSSAGADTVISVQSGPDDFLLIVDRFQTISVINTIVLALLLNPDAQKKAHAELTRLMGKANRLPGFDDIQSLPYCIAIVREALRWRPTAPISIPHRLMNDDVYNGMFMPGGSIVIGNAW
jgi:hypothetical protein